MEVEISAGMHDLLSDNRRAFAILATMMKDGTPQATPVWFDVEDGLIRVNTARGRVKERNMQERPEVALTIIDPDNWYRYLQIRGTVVEVTEEGARDHIDHLAGKYTGTPEYRGPVTSPRVIFKIRPSAVFSNA